MITRRLNTKKYNFVCTGHIGIGYAIVEKIINIIRSHDSQPKVIFGGPLVTSEPKLIFENLKPDFAILGEGEITIIELLKAVERKIDQLETEYKQLQQMINANTISNDQLQDEIQRMNELKGLVEKKYEEWSELSSILEA